MDHDLSDWRDQIDAIDAQLVALLNQRCQCALEVGRYKQLHERAVCDPDRELTVLANVARLNPGPLPQPVLRRLFEQIMAEMRTLQSEEQRKERRGRQRPRAMATRLP